MSDNRILENGDMIVHVSELDGNALNMWAHIAVTGKVSEAQVEACSFPNYAGDWSIGGPIIQMEHIGITPIPPGMAVWAAIWPRPAAEVGNVVVLSQAAGKKAPKVMTHGATPLIAAFRALIGGKCGAELAVPASIHGKFDLKLVGGTMQ